MKTLHTPAPWSVKKASPQAGIIIAPNRSLGIAEVFGGGETEIANALLIAAAPDLLAICEEIANDSKCDLVNSERRIRLYSALSKAKGERIK